MRLTEAEACTKQCHQFPAAMIPTVNTGSIAAPANHQQISYGWGNCVGPKCGAWRWMMIQTLVVPADGGPSKLVPQSVIAPGTEQPVGYCGYAGRPD